MSDPEHDRFNSDEKGDRQANDRFLPGHGLPGPGRPRGLDFRAVVAAKAAAAGVALEDALWAVAKALLGKAQDGDIQAAKLILDRICVNDSLALHITGDGEIPFLQ